MMMILMKIKAIYQNFLYVGILFLILNVNTHCVHGYSSSTMIPTNSHVGVPVGIFVDSEFYSDIKNYTETTISYLNNGIKYGRNKWAFRINVIQMSDSNEIIRAFCNEISRGVVAIIGFTNPSTSNTLRTYTNLHKIPFISLSHMASKYEAKTFSYHDETPPIPNRAIHQLNAHGTGENDNQISQTTTKIFQTDSIAYETLTSGQPETTTPTSQYDTSVSPDSANIKNEKEENNFHINIHPDMVPLLISLIKYNRWHSIFYVYNHAEALNRLQGLFDYQIKETDFVTNILLRKINDINNCSSILKSIDQYSIEADRQTARPRSASIDITMLVDLDSRESYIAFLTQIRNLGMIKIKYHYLLVTFALNDNELNEFRHGGLNITGFSMVDYKNLNTLTLLSDALQMNVPLNKVPQISYKAALLIDALVLFSKQINPLIGKNVNKLFGIDGISLRKSDIYVNSRRGINCTIDNYTLQETWPLGQLVLENIKNINNFEGLTGPINFDNNGKRINYTININRVALNMPLAKIGYFSSTSGLKIIEEAIFRERDGFSTINRNRKRIVVTIMDAPFFMLKPPQPERNFTGNERYEGYCVDLAEHLSKIVNFTYEFRLVKDGKFGNKGPDGNWNGMIGELVRHEADLAISSLTITLVREKAVEFSLPFMNLGISIMVYKPEDKKPHVFSFMAPLSPEIWMCVILAYVGISVILFLVSRFSPYEWKLEHNMGEKKLSNDFTIFNAFWFSLAAFMGQGIDIAPKSISGRLVTSAWWFFTLILISSYTANLAAFLTVQRMVSPIESAEDLAKQIDIQYGSLEGGSTKEFFRTSKVQIYQRMWSFMNGLADKVFVKSNLEGVNKVRESKGRYAFILESSVNEYLNERKPCDTMKVGSNLDSKGYGIATPIGSDLKEAINLGVLQLREDGTLEGLKTKWWKERSECHDNQKASSSSKGGSSSSTLSLDKVVGIFYLLIIGLVISVIFAAIEVLYKARVEARRSRTKFKEAIKSKMRLSITGFDENSTINTDELENLRARFNTESNGKSKERVDLNHLGWSVEPDSSQNYKC